MYGFYIQTHFSAVYKGCTEFAFPSHKFKLVALINYLHISTMSFSSHKLVTLKSKFCLFFFRAFFNFSSYLATDWMCSTSSPNQIPNVMVLEMGPLGGASGYQGRVLMNGISALNKRDPRELPCPFHQAWRLQSVNQEGPCQTPNLPASQSPKLWEISFHCL